jgi:hypothetical protein
LNTLRQCASFNAKEYADKKRKEKKKREREREEEEEEAEDKLQF